MKFFFQFSILILLFQAPALSQNESTYNLLWKIESPNKKNNSYLFGTMHIQDERAFNFSDSVMLAIEECHLFALEVHPDTMIKATFKELLNPDTTNYYKALMNDDEYDSFIQRYEKETGIDFEALETKNPFVIQSYENEGPKPFAKDRQTYVDMYLYGIAETLEKKTFGLENVDNQIESLKFDHIFSQKYHQHYDTVGNYNLQDQLTDTYNQGNLEDIKSILSNSILDSKIMTRRNNEMTESLTKLMHEASTFAAVGAAHLIGESSILKLLKEKGYTVSPVSATFTGVADNYKIETGKGAWLNFTDEQGAYLISFPKQYIDYSQKYPYEGQDSIFVNTLIHTDLINMKNYMFGYNDFPSGYYLDDPNSIYNSFEEEIKLSAKLLEDPVDIIRDNIKGKEYKLIDENDGYLYLVRIFVKGNRSYKIIYQDINATEISEVDSKFINSLHFLPAQVTFPMIESNEHVQNFPKFKKLKIEVDSIVDVNAYLSKQYSISSVNPATGGCYLTHKAQFDPYYKIISLDSFYNFTTNYLLNYNDSIVSQKDIIINDSLGREYITFNKYYKNYTRQKFWIYKDAMMMQSLFADSTEIFSATADSFFNVHPLPTNSKTIDLYSNKAKLILKNVESQDSMTKVRALGAFNYYYFDKNDISLLQSLLKTKYTTDSLDNQIALLLLNEFSTINDSTSTIFLKDLYLSQSASDILKVKLINTLIDLGDIDSYLETLFNDPPKDTKEDYYLIAPFRDSLDLFYKNINQFLPLLQYRDHRTYFLELTNNLLEKNNDDYNNSIYDIYPQLLEHWDIDLKVYEDKIAKKNTNYLYDMTMSRYLNLFINNRNETHQKYIKALDKSDTIDLYKNQIELAKIVNDLAYDVTYIDSLLQSHNENYSVIEAFIIGDKFDYLPDSLKSVDAISLAMLKQEFYYYEDISLDSIHQVKEITIDSNLYKLYKFDYTYYYDSGEKEIAYGIVGPIEGEKKDINIKLLNASHYYLKNDEAFYDKIQEHIKTHLSWY